MDKHEALYKDVSSLEVVAYTKCDGDFDDGVKFILKKLDAIPVADVEPVRHGHNENKEYHEADEFRCSECGLHLEDWTRYVYDEDSDEEYTQEYVFKYCPECGAKIVGE